MTKRWMKGEIARGLLLLALGTILASGTVFAETGAGEAAFANSFKNNEAEIVYLNGAEETVEESALLGQDYTVVNMGGANYTIPVYYINDTVIEGITDKPYTGSAVTLSLTVRYTDEYGQPHVLTEGEEYTLSYENNVKPGTASVTITGTKKLYTDPMYHDYYYWTGSVTKTFKITGQEPSAGTEPSTGAPIGTTVEAGSGASLALYQVTGKDTVTYVKCRAAKNAKAVQIPPTVTINRAVYRVTAVAASACAGRGKVTKLTIGANVEAIGGKAFSKCKKLKVLTVKTAKLTAAKCKKCLKGSAIQTVKVPKAKKKAYKKIFKKSVCGKNVKLK